MSHHTISSTIGPWFFMTCGVLLALKPNIFVRGIWKKTDIAQRLLSPKAYLLYTRSVGVFFIIAGLIWLFLQPAAESRRHTENSIGAVTSASNHSMKPTRPLRGNLGEFATTLSRGLSLSR